MHPSVDNPKAALPPARDPTAEIDYAARAARALLKESTMRNTIQALLCAIIASACAPIGEQGGGDFEGPDAGADGSSTTGACENLELRRLDLTISGSAGFTNLPAGCWKLDGRLTLIGPAVTSLAKLGDLREVRDLVIDDTDLTKVDTKNPLEVSGAITVRNNDKLADLANVSAKPTVAAIHVEYNPELTSLGGLAKATVVTGETKVASNNKLVALNLGTTSRFEGGLIVSDNLALTTVDLHTLDSVGSLMLRHNPALTGLQLAALSYVHGALTIDDNDNLGGLAGLGDGLNVTLGVSVTNNAKLATVTPLAHAAFVGGGVVLSGNTALDFTAGHEIDCCANTGAVTIANNKSTTCSGNHWCLAGQGTCPF